jgi:hypothetical protein
MNHGLVEKILLQPDAPLLVQQLNQHLTEERRRRLSFYNWIDEHIKAEFINGEVVDGKAQPVIVHDGGKKAPAGKKA